MIENNIIQTQPKLAFFDGQSSEGVSGLHHRETKIPFSTRRVIDLDIVSSNSDAIIKFIVGAIDAKRRVKVAFANSNLFIQTIRQKTANDTLRDFMILNDGVAIDAASYILYGKSFPENLNGTDFMPKLLSATPAGTRVFLYGSLPEVVEETAKAIESRFGVTVCGFADGYGHMADPKSVLKKIEESRPDILLVALGNPKQELWLSENWPRLATPIGICVGAWMDFFIGHKKRAPAPFRALRLEWLFRLLTEPRRLWRRYSVDVVAFFFLVFRQALTN